MPLKQVSQQGQVSSSGHGPFSAYLKKVSASDSHQCSCRNWRALHATECALTVSSHIRRPAPDSLEQEWLMWSPITRLQGQKKSAGRSTISENRDPS
ncbi:hypothetical protein AVEN_63347-1 [Araneus ventricosus]|uniref:Uncharacterized protein n=1 Tax=Araneus ventricosus TaxID=182803 RepID=A0A4Y2WEY1_ARAVE|nr:hypothetical protein AVEN_63347-1 [Araneus ventricosus]